MSKQLAAFHAKGVMREEYVTPPAIFDPLHEEFGFTMDAAANASNAKVPRFLGPGSPYATDALSVDWSNEVVWLNPPYGHVALALWMRKVVEQRQHSTIVSLVPSYTGQPWWQQSVVGHADEMRWLPGKVRFVGEPSCSRFYSVVLIYGRRVSPQQRKRKVA